MPASSDAYRAIRRLAAWAGCAWVSCAHAQVPVDLEAYEQGVLRRGVCEMELEYTRQGHGGDEGRVTDQAASLSCGSAWGTQWSAGAWRESAVEGSRRGMQLAARWRLGRDELDPDPPWWVLAVDVRNARRGAPDDSRGRIEVVLEHGRRLANDWYAQLRLGAGREREPEASTRALWSIEVSHEAYDWGAPLAELSGEQGERPWARAGVRFDAHERLYATLVAGLRPGRAQGYSVSLQVGLIFP